MVRSAGMYFTSEAVKYLPSVDEVVQFQPLVSGGSGGDGDGAAAAGSEGQRPALSSETIRAATNLDQVRLVFL